MRNHFAAAVCLLLLLFLCACTPQQEMPQDTSDTTVTPITEPTTKDTTQQEDDEVAAAIAAGESKLFWRIEESAQLGGTASMWQYTPMDCGTLWADIQAQLLPDATVQSSETVEEGSGQSVKLLLGADTIQVDISATGITFIGYTPDSATAFARELAALLTEQSGFTLTEVPADEEEGEILRFAFCTEGIAVDTEPYDVTMGSALRVFDSGSIMLEYPITLGERGETYDLSQYFSMEEAKILCEMQWTANLMPLVCTLNDYQPIYIVDATNGRLVPGWQFLGRFWEISDTGYNHSMDYVIDALTGAVIRFG